MTKKKTIKQSDLYQKQLLLLDEGHCLRGHALQLCQLNGAKERQDVRATSLETLRQMDRVGTGITFIPEIAIPESDPYICYLPLSDPVPNRSIGLVWRKTCARNKLITHLIDLIKTTVNV